MLDGSGEIVQKLALPKFLQKCAHPSREKRFFFFILGAICILLSPLLNFIGNMEL